MDVSWWLADASTTCLLSFGYGDGSGRDGLAEEDLELLWQPDRFWGIRLLARAHFRMSTSEFRGVLRKKGLRLRRWEHSLSAVAAFLRSKHPGESGQC